MWIEWKYVKIFFFKLERESPVKKEKWIDQLTVLKAVRTFGNCPWRILDSMICYVKTDAFYILACWIALGRSQFETQCDAGAFLRADITKIEAQFYRHYVKKMNTPHGRSQTSPRHLACESSLLYDFPCFTESPGEWRHITSPNGVPTYARPYCFIMLIASRDIFRFSSHLISIYVVHFVAVLTMRRFKPSHVSCGYPEDFIIYYLMLRILQKKFGSLIILSPNVTIHTPEFMIFSKEYFIGNWWPW